MKKAFKKPDLNAPRFRSKRMSILKKSLFDDFKDKHPQYKEIEKALKSLLVGYESQYSESHIKEARQEYANKQSDFQEELDQIEEKLDCDGGLECNEAWQFFHRDARRRRPIRKFR